MNPQSSESGLHLPPPISAEQMPAPAGSEQAKSAPEQAPQSAERAPSAAAAMPAAGAMPALPPMPVPAAMPAQTDVSTTSSSQIMGDLDDHDLIEKEWVNKAKQIVERTRRDPYQQSEALTEVKADYMKKRYNKQIKVTK